MNCLGLCRQSKTAELAEELDFKQNRVKQGTVFCFIFNQLFLIVFYMSVFPWHNKTSYGSFFNSTIGGCFFYCPFFTDLFRWFGGCFCLALIQFAFTIQGIAPVLCPVLQGTVSCSTYLNFFYQFVRFFHRKIVCFFGFRRDFYNSIRTKNKWRCKIIAVIVWKPFVATLFNRTNTW